MNRAETMQYLRGVIDKTSAQCSADIRKKMLEEREQRSQAIILRASTLGLRAEVIVADYVNLYNGDTVVQAGLNFDEVEALLYRYA